MFMIKTGYDQVISKKYDREQNQNQRTTKCQTYVTEQHTGNSSQTYSSPRTKNQEGLNEHRDIDKIWMKTGHESKQTQNNVEVSTIAQWAATCDE